MQCQNTAHSSVLTAQMQFAILKIFAKRIGNTGHQVPIFWCIKIFVEKNLFGSVEVLLIFCVRFCITKFFFSNAGSQLW